ncbi:MAG: ABC-type microcin C transport system substrate-binding component YejA [Rhodobacteraceae bacterium HLUCCA12]|nr:MAG: ABC-type microcin C transport system substrate-binding component YejA [Rhodobacteraceae bacterium HLUCCA12]
MTRPTAAPASIGMQWLAWRGFGAGLALALAAAALAGEARGQDGDDEVIEAHGYSFYGELSYPEDFEHYSYVNPDAPRGGEISLWAPGTFDSMNPYSRRGRAGRYSWALYESLLETSGPFGDSAPADVYGEYYGLLAHTVEYPPSKDWVIFHMRPEARFSDGTPVTAHDVVFTHNLFLEQGLPSYSEAVRYRVVEAEALDDHTVRFEFRSDISRRSLIDQVGSTPVMPRAWFEETGARLDESRLETAPGSGPYVLDSYEINRRITYRRNPDYWGWELPNNVGRHNFDVVRVEYFADDSAAFEAFKTGEYTFRAEGNSRQWAVGYDFPAVERGHVVREEIPDGTPPTPTGFVFNLDRPQLQDRRVREALSLAYNFEWTNQQLQYGLMSQRHSFTQDTPLEAQGAPEGEERALLESLGDLVPDALLEEPAVMAHESSTERLQDRRNLRTANRLLEEAGWVVGSDGVRRNDEGQVLRIEIPYSNSSSSTLESVIETFVQNLRAMGVDARARKIDPAQYTSRSRDRDYDMIFDEYVAFQDTGTGLHQRYGSEAADDVFNPAGLRSPLVDAVIDLSLDAPTPEERDVALRALDRVLRWERFIIPVWYNPDSWVAYWDMYRHPEDLPLYADGVLDFWWYDDEAAEELRAAGALR